MAEELKWSYFEDDGVGLYLNVYNSIDIKMNKAIRQKRSTITITMVIVVEYMHHDNDDNGIQQHSMNAYTCVHLNVCVTIDHLVILNMFLLFSTTLLIMTATSILIW